VSNVRIDLSTNNLFSDNEINFDKKLIFVFGKNGTGKSTLASLIEPQVPNYNFSKFQGFDNIVGEDLKLNAVILGEENNEIDKKIKAIEEKIKQKRNEIKQIEKETLPSNDDNIWSNAYAAEKKYNNQSKKIESFYKKSASKIKNMNNPRLVPISYNYNNFKEDISNAELLTEIDINNHLKIMSSTVKMAEKIYFTNFEVEKLYEKTNNLLVKKISEKELIPEIYKNIEKTNFARQGMLIHKPNERCSFCGNVVSSDRYEKLESYFSVDEVKSFISELNHHKSLIEKEIMDIEELYIDDYNFYADNIDEIDKIKDKFTIEKNLVLNLLRVLDKSIDNKMKNLFGESKKLSLTVPNSLNNYIKLYNELVEKNNSSDLLQKQKQSEKMLKNHEIKLCLIEFKYEEEKKALDIWESVYKEKKLKLDLENQKIINLKNNINKLELEIVDLQSKTKNEKILANKINDKLELYVNFKLEYLEEKKERGHYQVRCKNTRELRNITQLSTGEKNIIAFLYFIQKLDEINNPKSNLSKFIIFDDPMTSNDDTMQYIIIDELNNLISNLKNDDRIIIMTHNNHFYLNVKYKYNNKYDNNLYLRLESNGVKTYIRKIDNLEDDFRTNYEALWQELIFIYNNAPSDSMLLNPIRRIIETFTKFNCIKKSKMLGHVAGAEKLFNVNSHAIDDLEAELNGRNKKDIIRMMKKCFEKEHHLEHFDKYWNINLGDDLD